MAWFGPEVGGNLNRIVDVTVRGLEPIGDMRGALCEIHRDAWEAAPRPVQWDLVRSKPNVLRGMHVHRLRWDYLIVLEGHATIGLADARRDRSSFRQTMTIDLPDGRPTVVTIPPGVAHGVYANSALRYLYGLTVAWDGGDEDLGCRYDDPGLGLKWPGKTPVLLPRDLDLPDFARMVERYAETSSKAPP